MATKKTAPPNPKANEFLLKERVKELEGEVSSLKARLEDLRKAKNTTVLKREREVLEVGVPFGRRNSKTEAGTGEASRKDLEDLKRTMLAEKEKEIVALRLKFEEDMAQALKQKKEGDNCGHEPELMRLRGRVADLESEASSLRLVNSDLQDQVDSLHSQLSIKEATWCEMEEKLNLKVKESWKQKYEEWMKSTEEKIVELQQANALLRSYLQRSQDAPSQP